MWLDADEKNLPKLLLGSIRLLEVVKEWVNNSVETSL